MYKVYGDIYSGNCYKIKLLLHLLELPHTWQAIDILKGESRTEEFRSKNPNGKIPLIELENGDFLSESNAILFHLAQSSRYWPMEGWDQAKVMQWLFFEQYSHEPNVATARYIIRYLNRPEDRETVLQEKQKKGVQALQVLEDHFQDHSFLVGEAYTIADIALYAYTHVADEGGFQLGDFPQIQQWIGRMQSHPRHVTMKQAVALI